MEHDLGLRLMKCERHATLELSLDWNAQHTLPSAHGICASPFLLLGKGLLAHLPRPLGEAYPEQLKLCDAVDTSV